MPIKDGDIVNEPEPLDYDAIADSVENEDLKKSNIADSTAGKIAPMRTGMVTDESTPEHIRRTRAQLSGFSNWLYSRDLQRLTREHVLKISEKFFEAQYADIEHLLMLGMDIQKRQRFLQYLKSNEEIQKQIQNLSAAVQSEVVASYFDSAANEFKRKNNRDLELKKAKQAGNLDQRQYNILREENEEITFKLKGTLKKTMETLLDRHTEFLYDTLKVFKANLLTDNKL